jgi:hypothetical protein
VPSASRRLPAFDNSAASLASPGPCAQPKHLRAFLVERASREKFSTNPYQYYDQAPRGLAGPPSALVSASALAARRINSLIAAALVGIRSRNLNSSIASSKARSTSTWRRMVRRFMVHSNAKVRV